MQEYSGNLTKEKGWPKLRSPIIWRELVDKGGIATLIGDARDFQEYVHTYYGQTSAFTSQELLRMTADNERYVDEKLANEAEYKSRKKEWTKLAIVGAECPTARRICMLLGIQKPKRSSDKMIINLFPAHPDKIKHVEELKVILDDSACSGFHDSEVCVKIKDALEGAAMVVILDIVPRDLKVSVDGVTLLIESRSSWLNRRYHYLYKLGQNIAHFCNPNVKVLVAGSLQLFDGAEIFTSPINFDVHTLHVACKATISTGNIVGLPRALEYRLKAAIAASLGVRRCDLVDLIIWGNIDNTFHVDVSQARVYRRHGPLDAECGPAWFSLAAQPLILDHDELQNTVIPNALVNMKSSQRHRSALCHAAAVVSFIEQWHFRKVDKNESICSLVIASPGKCRIEAISTLKGLLTK